MKLKKLLLIACVAIVGSTFAQKDTLRFNLNGNEVIILTDDINKLSTTDINGMIYMINQETQKLTKEFNERVAELNRQLEAGEITEEEYSAKMELEAERFEIKMEAMSDLMEEWSDNYGDQWENWAEEYSESWEEWGEEYGESWENWADKWEDDAANRDGKMPSPPPPPKLPESSPPISSDGTTIIIKPGQIEITEDGETSTLEYKYHRTRQAQTRGQFDIHYGWNNLFEDGQMVRNVNGEGGELRQWQSSVFTLGGAAKTRVGSDYSKFYVRYGMQFNWQHFRLKGNNVISKIPEPDGVAFVPIDSISTDIFNVAKSSFSVWYLDVPLMFTLDFSKKGMDNGFSISAGGYGGIKLSQKRKIKFDDFNSDRSKERLRNNFYLNQWRYGVLAQIGFGAFKITGKYDLNPLFRTDKTTPNYQVGSVAIGFSW